MPIDKEQNSEKQESPKRLYCASGMLLIKDEWRSYDWLIEAESFLEAAQIAAAEETFKIHSLSDEVMPLETNAAFDGRKDIESADRYLEKAKEYTGYNYAEIIDSNEDGTWNLISCIQTDDEYCHCWLVRVWKNALGDLVVATEYKDTARIEEADAQATRLGAAMAEATINYNFPLEKKINSKP